MVMVCSMGDVLPNVLFRAYLGNRTNDYNSNFDVQIVFQDIISFSFIGHIGLLLL